MNKLIQLILISIILAGCQKDEAISSFEWPYWGEASSLKNGIDWKPVSIRLTPYCKSALRYITFAKKFSNAIQQRTNWSVGIRMGAIRAEHQ
ncbi:MAG: hypothetical protein IPM42_03090 [Saprospiraceae bacterium]|nr:hypothetical protein [Saprospiraceae bacterium]